MKNPINAIGKNCIKLLWLTAMVLCFSCEKEQLPNDLTLGSQLNSRAENVGKAIPNKVEVVTTHMNLEMPSTVPSGWTTFRYSNKSHSTHFFLLQKLPGDKTFEDSKTEVVPVFQEGMNYINIGDWDNALLAFSKLPAWSADIIYWGGVGLLSPGGLVESTVFLEPGNYAVECYVKNDQGVFHSANGMITGLTVTDEENGYSPPKSTFQVSISSQDGIMMDRNPRPGEHTIEVFFEDQTVYSHFLGHDVHLVKLDHTADLDELNAWMNWSDPAAFKTPVPEGVAFLGGMQDLPALEGKPASHMGYFEVNLKPGRYALIAEVPDPRSKNMFRIFSVPAVPD